VGSADNARRTDGAIKRIVSKPPAYSPRVKYAIRFSAPGSTSCWPHSSRGKWSKVQIPWAVSAGRAEASVWKVERAAL
jgi:hypothetical protein